MRVLALTLYTRVRFAVYVCDLLCVWVVGGMFVCSCAFGFVRC